MTGSNVGPFRTPDGVVFGSHSGMTFPSSSCAPRKPLSQDYCNARICHFLFLIHVQWLALVVSQCVAIEFPTDVTSFKYWL